MDKMAEEWRKGQEKFVRNVIVKTHLIFFFGTLYEESVTVVRYIIKLTVRLCEWRWTRCLGIFFWTVRRIADFVKCITAPRVYKRRINFLKSRKYSMVRRRTTRKGRRTLWSAWFTTPLTQHRFVCPFLVPTILTVTSHLGGNKLVNRNRTSIVLKRAIEDEYGAYTVQLTRSCI